MKLYMFFTTFFACIGTFVFENPSVQGEDDALELTDAMLLNSAAIKNYDVTVEEWSSQVEADGGPAKFSDLETSVKRRIVVDYEKEKVLEIRRTTWSRNPAPSDAPHSEREPGVQLAYFVYQDKTGISAPFGTPVQETKSLSFWEFLLKSRVPNIPLCTLGTYPVQHTKHGSNIVLCDRLSELMHKHMSDPKGTVRTLGDGTRFVKWAAEDGTGRSFIFDPRFVPAVTESWTQKGHNGELKEVDRVERKLEEVGGVFRITGLTYHHDSVALISAYTDEKVPTTEIGTVELTWHKFNEDELIFPEIEKLVSSGKLLNEFLDAKKAD